MPGKRTSSDPGEQNGNVRDADAKRAGIQSSSAGPTGGGQWEQGEAPVENAYRETPHKDRP